MPVKARTERTREGETMVKREKKSVGRNPSPKSMPQKLGEGVSRMRGASGLGTISEMRVEMSNMDRLLNQKSPEK